MIKLTLLMGGAFCGLSVVLGAFAAHGLKKLISPEMVAVFQTGVHYQFFHGLALILFALVVFQGPQLRVASYFLIAGVVLFSGSLYLLALTGNKLFGPITPIGGVCMIIGWAMFFYSVAQYKFD